MMVKHSIQFLLQKPKTIFSTLGKNHSLPEIKHLNQIFINYLTDRANSRHTQNANHKFNTILHFHI